MPTSPLPLADVRVVNPVDTRYVQTKKQSLDSFIGARIYPVLPSDSSGTFYKWADGAFTGGGHTTPAGTHGGRAIGGDFAQLPPTSMTTDTYKTTEYGFQEALDDTLLAKSQVPISLTNATNDRLLLEVMRAREVRIQSVVTATASISTNNTTLSGTDQWSDYANSDPVDDIETAIEALRLSVVGDEAMYDLCCATNDVVWRYLRWHPDITNKMADSKTKRAKEDDFREFFGFDDIIVGRAVKNSAKPGQTVTNARLWGDDFLIFFRPKAASKETCSLGYTFSFQDVRSESWRNEPRTNWYLVCHDESNKLIHEASAYLIKDCLA